MAHAESMCCLDALSTSPGVFPTSPAMWKLVIFTGRFPSHGCCQIPQTSLLLIAHPSWAAVAFALWAHHHLPPYQVPIPQVQDP